LWWVQAYDPQGNPRGIGTDMTLPGALAAAWILSDDEVAELLRLCEFRGLSLRDFDCVARHVPDDWTFEVDNMPASGSG
jgi:hypothetical protein